MDYRVFNLRTKIILMRAYTHWRLGTPTMSQHNIFDAEKLTIVSCAPSDGVPPGLLKLR